jgi:hypothetical protein
VKINLLAAAGAAIIGVGALSAAGAASARVVCNAEGDCWHVDNRVAAVPGVRFTYHNDDWYFHQHWDDRHHWRENHEGRGYWRRGEWVPR